MFLGVSALTNRMCVRFQFTDDSGFWLTINRRGKILDATEGIQNLLGYNLVSETAFRMWTRAAILIMVLRNYEIMYIR